MIIFFQDLFRSQFTTHTAFLSLSLRSDPRSIEPTTLHPPSTSSPQQSIVKLTLMTMPGMRSSILLFLFTSLVLALSVGAETDGQCTYSFFFFTFRQPFAAKAVYDRVRLFYPSAPMVSLLFSEYIVTCVLA
jgi:hypothetical protein